MERRADCGQPAAGWLQRRARLRFGLILESHRHAFRIMLTRVAREKALPFEPLVPNATTIEAMKEARRGGLKSFATVEDLMADLELQAPAQ